MPSPVACSLLFLDSGSFSLHSQALRYAKEHGAGRWDFYDSDAHWAYVDAYAAFVKKNKDVVDLYANIDVIGNAKLSWRNQRYLEKKGLRPVPVVHQGSGVEWIERYEAAGHNLIALGGMVSGREMRAGLLRWLDVCFDFLCPPPARLPRVRVHGFGLTSVELMHRYPWWSVDSASWTKVGAYGGVLVPPRKAGEWRFDCTPLAVDFSLNGKARDGKRRSIGVPQHRFVLAAKPAHKGWRDLRDWLDEIGVPLGRAGKDGEVLEYGVTNRHSERKMANLLYFERLRASLPAYPWPFRPASARKGYTSVKRSLGL